MTGPSDLRWFEDLLPGARETDPSDRVIPYAAIEALYERYRPTTTIVVGAEEVADCLRQQCPLAVRVLVSELIEPDRALTIAAPPPFDGAVTREWLQPWMSSTR